jgi:3-methylfumaryl-CoA hydratase
VIHLDRAREWLGRVDVRADCATAASLAALFDLLDLGEPAPKAGDELPPLAHWLYFRPWGRSSETRENGDFLDPTLPPIELPHRQCVESRITFHRPMRVVDPISRLSRVIDVAERPGRVGQIVTLLLHHEIADSDGLALSEERRLIYTSRGEAWDSIEPRLVRGEAHWRRQFHPHTQALFRYAALTRDSSRIHYDRPFATFVEGHPGLIVQWGLVAALLFDLLREHAPGCRVRNCEIRVHRWLYDTEPMTLSGRARDNCSAELWAEDPRGRLAVEVLATMDSDFASGHDVGRATTEAASKRKAAPAGPSLV